MKALAKLEEVHNLREIWPHEALDFTPWLAEDENIILLADAIGIDITVDEQESSVGNFNVDILASETGTDRKIIIENQLEDTNHDHLGKLITYASGKSASIIIWVVKKAREEHRAAIEWLNNHTDNDVGFFLCEIKVYQIGDSAPAVKFDVIEKPNDWTKEIKRINGSSKTAQQENMEHWTVFNDYAFNNAAFKKEFRSRKPSKSHWQSFGIGSSACTLYASNRPSDGRALIEFYIHDDKELYRRLYSMKDQIETEAGFSMEWRELPGIKASCVDVYQNADEASEEGRAQFDWMIKTMLVMKKVFKKYL